MFQKPFDTWLRCLQPSQAGRLVYNFQNSCNFCTNVNSLSIYNLCSSLLFKICPLCLQNPGALVLPPPGLLELHILFSLFIMNYLIAGNLRPTYYTHLSVPHVAETCTAIVRNLLLENSLVEYSSPVTFWQMSSPLIFLPGARLRRHAISRRRPFSGARAVKFDHYFCFLRRRHRHLSSECC